MYIGIRDNGSVCGIENHEKVVEILPSKINNRLVLDILRTKYLKSYISYEGIHRREKQEYPHTALKEVVINAHIHRDYTNTLNLQIKVFDNKLIMYNGALLSAEVPIEMFSKPHQSKPFNPIIASVFYKAGLIENWGRGTINIIKTYKDYLLPTPTFEYEFSAVKATFYNNATLNVARIGSLPCITCGSVAVAPTSAIKSYMGVRIYITIHKDDNGEFYFKKELSPQVGPFTIKVDTKNPKSVQQAFDKINLIKQLSKIDFN